MIFMLFGKIYNRVSVPCYKTELDNFYDSVIVRKKGKMNDSGTETFITKVEQGIILSYGLFCALLDQPTHNLRKEVALDNEGNKKKH